MCKRSFSPWPLFSKEEINAVTDVLSSNKVNYWTGDECRQFEREFAQFVGCRYAIAVANGTTALDLALLALDVGEGDEVIVTSRTFLASASTIVNARATPSLCGCVLGYAKYQLGLYRKSNYRPNKSDCLCSSCGLAM